MLYVLYMNRLENLPIGLQWGDQHPNENELHNFYKVVRRFHPVTDKPIEEVLELIFIEQQGEMWSPNGERQALIEELGLSHTSMSTGDVVYCSESKKLWIYAMRGFEEFVPEDLADGEPLQDVEKVLSIHSLSESVPLDYLVRPPADTTEGWMLGGKGWF